MSSGDIHNFRDERGAGGRQTAPIAGFTLEIVVASGTSEKQESVDINMLLTDLYIEAPAISTGVNNKFKLQLLTERDNIIYDTGYLDATSATDYAVHLQRGLRRPTKFKIICDGNVSENETFYIEVVGM